MTAPSSATPQDDTGRLGGNSEEASKSKDIKSMPSPRFVVLRDITTSLTHSHYVSGSNPNTNDALGYLTYTAYEIYNSYEEAYQAVQGSTSRAIILQEAVTDLSKNSPDTTTEPVGAVRIIKTTEVSPTIDTELDDTELDKLLEEIAFNYDHRNCGDSDCIHQHVYGENRAMLKAFIERETARARIDENDIWLAHSTSRRLNDNEPAIRTVDFRDRIGELEAALTSPHERRDDT